MQVVTGNYAKIYFKKKTFYVPWTQVSTTIFPGCHKTTYEKPRFNPITFTFSENSKQNKNSNDEIQS